MTLLTGLQNKLIGFEQTTHFGGKTMKKTLLAALLGNVLMASAATTRSIFQKKTATR